MNEKDLQKEAEKIKDLYSANYDHPGGQQIVGNKEKVLFAPNSSYRIWYNNVSTCYPVHWHESLEIIIPITNYYDVIADGVTYRVHPSEIMFLPSGTLHECIAPDTGERFSFLLDITDLQNLNGFARVQPVLSFPVLFTRAEFPFIYDDVFRILLKIKDEYFKRDELYEISIHALLLELVTLLGYNKIRQHETAGMGIQISKKYTSLFNDMLQYIDGHYAENITLEDAAERMGFSKFHFSRLFKEYTSFTFCDYINFRRIKAAESLLANPSIPITEVAMTAGFPSIPTFNRLFKSVKGCTPSEFRSKMSSVVFSKK